VSSPPASGRRRDRTPRKGERREAAILDALERLVTAMPFADVTMDHLAREAGLSRPALYFYVASKEEALLALHQRIFDSMSRTLEPMVVEGRPATTGMPEAIEQVCATWRTHPAALRAFRETAMTSATFAAPWRANIERHVSTIAGIIEREHAAGRADPAPLSAQQVAEWWFWTLERQLAELYSSRPTASAEQQLVATATTMWRRLIRAT
jgi:AcrR family transcriptional regulator